MTCPFFFSQIFRQKASTSSTTNAIATRGCHGQWSKGLEIFTSMPTKRTQSGPDVRWCCWSLKIGWQVIWCTSYENLLESRHLARSSLVNVIIYSQALMPQIIPKSRKIAMVVRWFFAVAAIKVKTFGWWHLLSVAFFGGWGGGGVLIKDKTCRSF